MTETHHVTAKLWRWTSNSSQGSWHFLTIAGDTAEAIQATALMRRLESGHRRGWGAIKVRASIGDTHWDTSIFPQSGGGEWLLPVKAAVRAAEGLTAGDEVTVAITL